MDGYKEMILTALPFKYMALVMVHTPSANMIFYDCPNRGHVVAYNLFENEYRVEIDCPKDKTVRDWFKPGNLIEVSEEK